MNFRDNLYRTMASSFAAVVMLCCAHVGTVNAQQYSLTNLGTLTGTDPVVLPYELNAAGQATGATLALPSFRSFLWSQSTGMVDIGSLSNGPDFSWAYSINDSGQVVGVSQTEVEGQSHAYLWSPNVPNGSSGTMVDLGVLSAEVGDDSSFAEGINNLGQATGGSRVEGQTHAFLWTPSVANGNTGSMVDLGRLGDAGSSTGRAVNATGTVVGDSYNDVDGEQAFVWIPDAPNGNTGTMSALPILPLAAGGSYANNINDNGQIVGYGPQELLNARRAYLWSTPSSPQDLGVLPGDLTSSAVDINNLGHVVGTSDAESSSRAFLWMEGVGMLDLNSLVNSTGNGWTLTQGISINDAGQILGIGVDPNGNSRGFLLTPVPEPSSILLAMFSAGALWSLRRRLAMRQRSSEL